jgi:hypothetical protein
MRFLGIIIAITIIDFVFLAFQLTGFLNFLGLSVLTVIVFMVMNRQIFHQRKTEEGVFYNPKEWPRAVALIFCLLVIATLIFLGVTTPFVFDPYKNMFAFVPIEVVKACAYISLALLCMVFFTLVIYSFKVLLTNRNDYIAINEDSIIFSDNNKLTEIKRSDILYGEKAGSSSCFNFILNNKEKISMDLKDLNFRGNSLEKMMKELKAITPSQPKTES